MISVQLPKSNMKSDRETCCTIIHLLSSPVLLSWSKAAKGTRSIKDLEDTSSLLSPLPPPNHHPHPQVPRQKSQKSEGNGHPTKDSRRTHPHYSGTNHSHHPPYYYQTHPQTSPSANHQVRSSRLNWQPRRPRGTFRRHVPRYSLGC